MITLLIRFVWLLLVMFDYIQGWGPKERQDCDYVIRAIQMVPNSLSNLVPCHKKELM